MVYILLFYYEKLIIFMTNQTPEKHHRFAFGKCLTGHCFE